MQNDEENMECILTAFVVDLCYYFAGVIRMRLLFRDIVTAFLMGFVLPGLLLNSVDFILHDLTKAAKDEEPLQEMQQCEPISMLLKHPDGNMQMDMNDYLVGVVLAEMPADFESEALKAQAVAARTYTWKACLTGGKHGDGSVCTKSSCCQAYISESDYIERGGTKEGIEKVRSAVLSNSGYVLYFDGELIEATYFSCSGGTTESAVSVWGTDFPYLKSVPSPGEEPSSRYCDTVVFTPREFQNALGVILEGTPSSWFGDVTYTQGGGVDTVMIGDFCYTGTQLRTLPCSLKKRGYLPSAG